MSKNLDFLLGESQQEDKKGFIIIDLSQIALSTIMATIKDEKITTALARHIILSSIKHNVLKFKKAGYSEIIIAVDNAMPTYWRREYAYYYKKNRSKGRDESSFDWQGYFDAMKIIIQEFKDNMPYIVSDIPKAEADDTIGVLTQYLSNQGHKVLIVSSDGDFTQLQRFKNVTQWSPMQKKFVKVKGKSPEYDLMTKIVKGDKKDCIAGIRVRSDYWYTHVEGERSPIIKTKFLDELADAKDPLSLLNEEEKARFIENEILLDLTKVREDIAALIMDNYNNYTHQPRGKIYKYFVKSGLSKLLPNVNDF